MKFDNPFAGRVKQPRIVGTVEQCRDALVRHRIAAHGTDDLGTFVDCAACAILERALGQAEQETKEPRPRAN